VLSPVLTLVLSPVLSFFIKWPTVATLVKLFLSFQLVSPYKLVGRWNLQLAQHHNVRVVTTLPKRVFHRVESSSRRHWPT